MGVASEEWALRALENIGMERMAMNRLTNVANGILCNRIPSEGALEDLARDYLRLAGEVERLTKERGELSEQLELDRTLVAECLTKANLEIDSRYWLTEGRGCYEWNDDRWHDEFRYAAVSIKDAIEPLTKVAANWTNCPMKEADVAKARIDLKERISSLEAALSVAREDSARLKWCFGDLENGATSEYIESILVHADTVESARLIIDRLRARAALEGK